MSYVYFAKCGDYVKIGFSYRPEQRVTSILKNPRMLVPTDFDWSAPIALIHTVPECVARDEKRLHEHFAPYREAGEWFHDTAEFRAELDALDYVTLADERLAARRAKIAAKLFSDDEVAA